MEASNLFAGIPADLPQELIRTLAAGQQGSGHGQVRIERIVSRGHASPPGFWYDQAEHEWVAVLKGRAALRFESGDRLLELGEGDFVNIPAHARHRVEWTAADTDTVWLAVFY